MRGISTERLIKIRDFYDILQELEERLGGKRQLRNCNGKMNWPKRGVYFFFENGEKRTRKNELRVVRIGTHALKYNSGANTRIIPTTDRIINISMHTYYAILHYRISTITSRFGTKYEQ